MSGNKLGRINRTVEAQDHNAEIERLLVEGETIKEGDKEVRVYPTSTEVAARLDVSKSWVSKFAKINRCFERRAALQNAIKQKTREKLVQNAANRAAFELADQLELCDNILRKFSDAITDRGVGNVTASDINCIVRLRHFLSGEADSRAEVKTETVTLEMMQEAHAHLMRMADEDREVVDSNGSGVRQLAPVPESESTDPGSKVYLKVDRVDQKEVAS